MKSTIKTLALTTALASPASAAITFTNGGFESGTTLTGSSPYSDVNEWFNTGSGNSASVALSPETPHGGSIAARVTAVSSPGVDTGHTIVAGDTFDLSFWARSNNADTTRDINWLLYYGTATDLTNVVASGQATDLPADTGTGDGGYQQYSFNNLAIGDTGAHGENLYLRFTNPGLGFPVIDDVSLSVTPVPEPSSTALLGLGGLALILRRRK